MRRLQENEETRNPDAIRDQVCQVLSHGLIESERTAQFWKPISTTTTKAEQAVEPMVSEVLLGS